MNKIFEIRYKYGIKTKIKTKNKTSVDFFGVLRKDFISINLFPKFFQSRKINAVDAINETVRDRIVAGWKGIVNPNRNGMTQLSIIPNKEPIRNVSIIFLFGKIFSQLKIPKIINEKIKRSQIIR